MDNKISYVNIAGNKIGNEGVQALTEVLKRDKPITFNLMRNELDDNSARILAKSLKDSGNIHSILSQVIK